MRNFVLFLATAALAAACTPEGNDVSLQLSVQPKWNGQDLAYSSMTQVQPETGDTFQFERTDMILSEFALIQADGSRLPLVDEAGDPIYAFFTKGRPYVDCSTSVDFLVPRFCHQIHV